MECKANYFTLKGKSLILFKGFIRLNKDKSINCEHKINETYNFSVTIPFDKCKLNKKVVLKNNFNINN